MEHYSWNDLNYNHINIDLSINNIQNNIEFSKYAEEFQHKYIPVYYSNLILEHFIIKDGIEKNEILKDIYESFYQNSGCLIIKNVFPVELMESYNEYLNKYPNDDILLKMSENNPQLLLKLLDNYIINIFIDNLLGFGKIGSCTTNSNLIDNMNNPLDFNENKRLFTRNQINSILPYYSLDVLIASDKMDIRNGSLEIIPGSHDINDIDVLIHNKDIFNKLEKHFVNVSLNRGDVLIYNRGICYREGNNISNNSRNSINIQYVYLLGLGTQKINHTKIIQNLVKNNIQKDEIDKFKERLYFSFNNK